jgi:ligand-binding SRPBCC domain-containing protein
VASWGWATPWQARHFGLPFQATSRITAHERPRRFVDEQVAGPFRSWWREHTFLPAVEGTLMVDVVRFETPYGALGRIAEPLVLTRYLRGLLMQSNEWLRRELDGG